jgi:hypothetical protein
MAKKKPDEDYNWLNDAFDEKKAAAEEERARKGSKLYVGLGCVFALAVLAFIILCVVAFFACLNL